MCGGDGGGIWRFPNAGGADCSFGPIRRVQVSKCFFLKNKRKGTRVFQDNRACPDRMSNEIHVSRQGRLHEALGAKGAHQEMQDSHCCPEKYDALFRVVMAYDS